MKAESFDINDCYFRMLKPREAADARRFTPTYRLLGTVAHRLGRQVLEVLTRSAVAA